RLRERMGVPVVMVVGEAITVTKADDAVRATAKLKKTMEVLLGTAQQAYPHDGGGQWWQPRDGGGTAPTPEEAAVADAEREVRRAQAATQRR
ncbi:MAG: 1-acyl-sn-glycerol-3-phosphate acyltransferase, partial [Terrimesophilobacter sp.]